MHKDQTWQIKIKAANRLVTSHETTMLKLARQIWRVAAATARTALIFTRYSLQLHAWSPSPSQQAAFDISDDL